MDSLALNEILARVSEYGNLVLQGLLVMLGGMIAMFLLYRLGYDVSAIAGLAILAVLVGATVVFFLIPFLPRLPFLPGQTIEVRGVLGVVEAITAYQTVIRTFDGQENTRLALPRIRLEEDFG